MRSIEWVETLSNKANTCSPSVPIARDRSSQLPQNYNTRADVVLTQNRGHAHKKLKSSALWRRDPNHGSRQTFGLHLPSERVANANRWLIIEAPAINY